MKVAGNEGYREAAELWRGTWGGSHALKYRARAGILLSFTQICDDKRKEQSGVENVWEASSPPRCPVLKASWKN